MSLSCPRSTALGVRFSFAVHFLILLILPAIAAPAQEQTALDRFVHSEDPAFGWQFQKSYPKAGYTIYQIRLTSEQWRALDEVQPDLWEHWLTVIVPAQVRTTTALLMIDRGDWDSPAPDPNNFAAFGAAAVATGMIVADVSAVPNQPLRFAGEARTRSEEAVIAYTWDKFLRGGEDQWLALFPMTKAVVWAMTATTQFCASPQGGGNTVDRFIVSGPSNRGWAAWLAAATDPRVVGLVSIVFDGLNMEESFRRHWQSYGFWSEALEEFEDLGIFAWLGSQRNGAAMRLIDPYQYRDRLTMPKYIINAAGDEFFVPTGWQSYLDGLPGDNYMRYVPNAGHMIDQGNDILVQDVLSRALVWVTAVVSGAPLPSFTWEFPSPERIVVKTKDHPSAVRVWQASNRNARDFRLEAIGPAWVSTEIQDSGGGVFEAAVEVPSRGWRAYFVELEFPSGSPVPLTFTTPLRVVPDTLPFPPPLATALAASYAPYTAPEAIASTFSEDLTSSVAVASSLPLPAELAGTSVRVIDARGAARQAGLFFVSPAQINFLVPPGTAEGVAEIQVRRNGERVTSGQLLVENIAPGVFSANGDGKGVAAAVAVIVQPDGSQQFQIVFDAGQPQGSRQAVPIDVAGSGQVYLSLFCTGLRNATEVTATVGGEPVGVFGPAPSPEFAGVDQINLGPLPPSLAGRGEAEIVITVDGVPANVVTVEIR